ncbi:hypothetical protein [Paenibacillus periandrae]|uniref:hypothetical protein n=1 Tax=Paenibacillus periandrae TaxID=1761741 RepID=UPI001F099E4F|nr:hypothetical protein [Paenibacillus periandrae]
MIGSKITLDIYAIMAELNLSIEKLEDSNVLDCTPGFQQAAAFPKRFELLESYSKEMDTAPLGR